MNKEDWREWVVYVVHDDQARGDPELLDTLAEYLEKCDLAKQKLRDLGFGWTGLDILETVKLLEGEL